MPAARWGQVDVGHTFSQAASLRDEFTVVSSLCITVHKLQHSLLHKTANVEQGRVDQVEIAGLADRKYRG